MAIAARLAKYGLTLEDVVWRMPLCVINQFLIYDELASGRQPRWHSDADFGVKTINQLLEDALTAGL